MKRCWAYITAWGDFNQIKQNVIRGLSKFDAFSDFFMRGKVSSEIKTLHLRLLYGIKPELFELVVKFKSIDRSIGRKLYNQGIKTEQQLLRLNANEFWQILNLPMETCKEIMDEIAQAAYNSVDLDDLLN